MNRKLHNTASALMVTSLMLALAALASDPAGAPASAPPQLVAAAAPGAALVSLADEATSAADAAVHARPAAKATARRIRQSMAMPFFSFVTRG